MADPTPDRNPVTTSTPLWLKVFGILVLLAVVLFVVVMVAGGGHIPRPHGVP